MSGQEPEERHTSNDRAYRVEVRCTLKPMKLAGNNWITESWTLLPTQILEPLHLNTSHQEPKDMYTNTHTYYGAVALAASFLDREKHHFGVEARIVEYKREVKSSLVRNEVKPIPDEIDEIFARAGIATDHDGQSE